MLADLEAGDAGRDWLELAADLGGSVRLEVPHVLGAGAAEQVEGDHTFDAGFAAWLAAGLLGAQKVGQGEGAAQRRQRAGLECLAAGEAIAAASRTAEHGEHGTPRGKRSITDLTLLSLPSHCNLLVASL